MHCVCHVLSNPALASMQLRRAILAIMGNAGALLLHPIARHEYTPWPKHETNLSTKSLKAKPAYLGTSSHVHAPLQASRALPRISRGVALSVKASQIRD